MEHIEDFYDITNKVTISIEDMLQAHYRRYGKETSNNPFTLIEESGWWSAMNDIGLINGKTLTILKDCLLGKSIDLILEKDI